jgi:hypothetical protein
VTHGPRWVDAGRPGKKGNESGPRRIVTFSIYWKISKRTELIRSKDFLSDFEKLQTRY